MWIEQQDFRFHEHARPGASVEAPREQYAAILVIGTSAGGKVLPANPEYNDRISRVLSDIASVSSRRDRFIEVGRLLRLFYDDLPHDCLKQELLGEIANEAGIGIRTVTHWMDIDRVYSPFGLPRDRLASIGWAKLAVLRNHVRETGGLEWLAIAETYSLIELKRIVHGGKGPRRSMLLTFSASDYSLVVKALLLRGATVSGGGRYLLGKEEAILRICTRIIDSQYDTRVKQDAQHEGA
jgi:hypothetical protein